MPFDDIDDGGDDIVRFANAHSRRPRDPPARRAAAGAACQPVGPAPPYEAQFAGRSADSGCAAACDGEPALPRCARRRARCLARRTRSLCHLTGLRSPRPTWATVAAYVTTSGTPTPHARPPRRVRRLRSEGPRRTIVREKVCETNPFAARDLRPPIDNLLSGRGAVNGEVLEEFLDGDAELFIVAVDGGPA